LPATGAAKFFKIAAPAAADLTVALTGPAGAVNELFLKFGDLPSRQSFDERGIRPNSANQSISVSNTVAGSYFVEVFAANISAAETFTITASLAGFSITGVTPSRGSNTGRVTIAIAGAQFDANSQPRLIDSAGGTLNPIDVFFTDSGLVSATFNLVGRPTGLADVQVVNPGNVVTTLPDSFNIVAGQPGRLVTNLIVPSRVRQARNFQVIVQYSNQGDTDLLAPIMHLAGMGFSQLSLPPDLAEPADRLDLVGTSPIGPAGILSPGSQNRIIVNGRASTAGDERFSLSVDENPDGALDWVAIKPTLRPPGISDADFDALFAEIQRIIGNTFADYRRAISDATTLLPPLMGDNQSLNDVFSLILHRALGNLSTSVGGTLFLSDTDHPLGKVRIELVQAVEDPQVILETISLNDGSFSVSQVPPGTYDVNFDGFVPNQPVQVTVSAAGLQGLSIILESAGIIEGSVVLASGGVPSQCGGYGRIEYR